MNNETINESFQDSLSFNQLSLNQQDQNQDQLDQQIKQSIDEARLDREENQASVFNDIDETDLSTPSQKLRGIINRKRKAEKKRQIAIKKKYD
jgi:hypothetical protein